MSAPVRQITSVNRPSPGASFENALAAQFARPAVACRPLLGDGSSDRAVELRAAMPVPLQAEDCE